MTITLDDIRNPARISGFDRVGDASGEVDRRTGRARWRARAYGGDIGKMGAAWTGPCRDTPEEAAQDYCAYINGSATPATPALKSAGHKREPRVESSAGVQAARAVLREELRKEKEAQDADGLRGHIYCIGERFTDVELKHGTLIDSYAVKVGHSRKSDRIAGGQTFNPRTLVRLATIEDRTESDESALHAKYIKDNVLGEWFRPTPELLSEFGLTMKVMAHGRCLWVKGGEA